MKRLTHRMPSSTTKIRLDDYLNEWLPTALGLALPKSKVRTLILSGAVYVNRHRNKIASTILFAGAVLEVYYDETKLNLGEHPSSAPAVVLTDEHILYEDEWIIVVNKNSGIPTQPTIDPGRANLFDLTKQYLTRRNSKKNIEVYLGLHHRLDRDTSGLVMFTKKEKANKGVSELFAQHRIQKTYQCLVWRMPESEGYHVDARFEVKNFLGRVSPKNENARFGSVHSGGDSAHTLFRVLEVFRGAYWLEAQPQTGRTHQIRVHTSELGLPILGDLQYFPKNVLPMIKASRLLLHAYQLEFDHPVTQEPMKIEAPLTDDFLRILGSLRS